MLEDLDFADDLALLSSSMKHLQSKTDSLIENAAKVGLKLNTKTCKMMIANSKNDEKLKVGDNEIEEVERFTYLGANVSNKGEITADIKKRIALASEQMKKLANVWNTSGITNRTKVILFKSLALSVLLYGSETWKLIKGEERKLDVFK